MTASQSGIFALGTASHAYLEFDIVDGVEPSALATAAADLREPRMTIGGVNLVLGFRPTLWSTVAPHHAPIGVHDFTEDLVGPDGFTMPATQHDLVLWIAGSAYDVVFDVAHAAIAALAAVATLRDETSSWPYQHDRDLTGFIDGTENPSLLEASDVVLVADDQPGAGGSVLFVQRWTQDATAWRALSRHEQEQAIGRTKPDSVELDPRPESSHVARTDQEDFGDIFRRNMPWGTISNHGTIFIGFSAVQRNLHAMLESMTGITTGVRDAITQFLTPHTGSYYVVPSLTGLGEFATPETD